MFRKITKPVQNLFSTIKQSKNFSSLKANKNPPQINSNLLYPFSPNNATNTMEALRKAHSHFQSSPNSHHFSRIDKYQTINFTPSSKTYKVRSQETDDLMTMKILQLNSYKDWEQINLILRQSVLCKPTLAHVLHIEFNEEAKEAKIFTEFFEKILSKYSDNHSEKVKPWTGDELAAFSWQFLNQLHTMKQLGADCASSINPQNVFIDKTTNLFKLYDFSDFNTYYEKFYRSDKPSEYNDEFPLINNMILSLMKIVDPSKVFKSPSEAREFLAQNNSDYMYHLELIESKIRELDFEKSANFSEKLHDEILINISKHHIFYERDFPINTNSSKLQKDNIHVDQIFNKESQKNIEFECNSNKESKNKEEVPNQENYQKPNQSQSFNDSKVKEAFYYLSRAMESIENSSMVDKNKIVELLTEFETVLKELNFDMKKAEIFKDKIKTVNKAHQQSSMSLNTELNTSESSKTFKQDKFTVENSTESKTPTDKIKENFQGYVKPVFKKIWDILNLGNFTIASLGIATMMFIGSLFFVVLEIIAYYIEPYIASPEKSPEESAVPPERPKVSYEGEKTPFKERMRWYLWILMFCMLSLIG